MTKSVILMTGCDAKFYSFMTEALNSWLDLNLDQKADIGILDLGLEPHQVAELKSKGYKVEQATWVLDVPEHVRVKYEVGLVARTALREYFPGYQVYLWFDADAWAQTPEFFTVLEQGARSHGVAVIRENGAGCARNYLYNRWWYGHLIMSFGLIDGIKVAMKPAINLGIVALSDKAPHWDIWRKRYMLMIEKRQRANMDQHAFNAAIELDQLPAFEAPATCNWVCTLSHPHWDADKKLLCEPNPGAKPLSVVHLAGPDKRRDYHLQTTTGGVFTTPVTYDAIKALQK